MRTMKLIKFFLMTVIMLSVITSCNMAPEGETDGESAVAEKKVKPVKVMELTFQETAIEQNVTATISAFEETYLSPALQGVIRSIKVEVNDRVSKGQLLVEMDRTQLEQTRLQYETLKTDFARMDTLIKTGSITQQSYDQMKAQVESTELILKNLEENTLLRAPYSGIITGKYYNDRELFSPAPNTPVGKAALVSIIQINPVKVMVNLSEKYLPLVKEGMSAIVRTEVYPGKTFTGNVFRIHPTVSPATRTFTVEVKIPNKNEKLRPGMFARVSLKLGEKEALIVPAITVLQQTGTNERYIMVHENGNAKRITVRILNRYDDKLEIASEYLQGGEELIIAGQVNLDDGESVNVVQD